jgi:rhamnulokinase
VVVGRVQRDRAVLHEVVRFANEPVAIREGVRVGLHWDVLGLYANALTGLARAAYAEPELAGIGVDSWGADYGLLARGELLGNPFHYRDERTAVGIAEVDERVPAEQLYTMNGLQFLPITTVYQLADDLRSGRLEHAETMLLIPDLFGYWLSGRLLTERTNASTTGLLKLGLPQWNSELIQRLGLSGRLFADIVEPGTTVGGLTPEVSAQVRAPHRLSLVAVGSHDTASAVVAVPMRPETAAFISCGTWSLVGAELARPLVSQAARAANFTNEVGLDGRTRFLHNVMGLWLLTESIRTWQRAGLQADLHTLLDQAAAVNGPVPIFDTDDQRFLPAGDIPARISAWCLERGLRPPESQPEFVRSILDSLASTFARTVDQVQTLTGIAIACIHLVGGGARNELLCQLTADRSGRPVVAGPVEATALGNVLVQARALDAVQGDLESLRAIVAASFTPRRYEPAAASAEPQITLLKREATQWRR